MMNVNIKLFENMSNGGLPVYQTEGSVGMDLTAAYGPWIKIKKGEFTLIETGIAIKVPKGYEAQIRSRSGLAAKFGICVLNSPGTIDQDYTGEIKVILINHGKSSFLVKPGDRIAQMVFSPIKKVKFQVVENLEKTKRGEDGFGSTGIQ